MGYLGYVQLILIRVCQKESHQYDYYEQACELCFGGRGHDKLDNLGDGEDWAVASWDSVAP